MANFVTLLKSSYVKLMRSLAKVTRKTGLFGFLERHKNRRWVHWLLSLGAIHDLEAMIALDVPWWSYKAIEQVDQFLGNNRDKRIFEYGSGASTVWLSKRAAHVTSVEHHKGWHDMLVQRPELTENVNILLREGTKITRADAVRSQKPDHTDLDFTDYVNAAFENDTKYDVVVIDGRAREACLQAAISIVTDDGLIVFDNSTRKRYQDGINAISGQVIRFKGLVPSLPYPDETTLISLKTVKR